MTLPKWFILRWTIISKGLRIVRQVDRLRNLHSELSIKYWRVSFLHGVLLYWLTPIPLALRGRICSTLLLSSYTPLLFRKSPGPFRWKRWESGRDCMVSFLQGILLEKSFRLSICLRSARTSEKLLLWDAWGKMWPSRCCGSRGRWVRNRAFLLECLDQSAC